MPITLGTNIAALGAQRHMNQASNRLEKVFERLSSGLRINRASDDAAGLAVSSSLQAKTRIYTQGVRNLNDGISALSIADQAIASLETIVQRQRELAEQAANGIYSTQQRTALNTEAQSLAAEYIRILQTTEFNGRKLIDGTSSGITLQGGIGSSAILNAQMLNTTVTETGIYTDAGTTTNSTLGWDGVGLTAYAQGLGVADFNNDGIDDIVALSVQSAGDDAAYLCVQVYLGNSSGSFTTPNTENNPIDFPMFAVSGGFILSASLNITFLDRSSDGDIDFNVSAGAFFDDLSVGIENEQFVNNLAPSGTFSINWANNDDTGSSGTPLGTGTHLAAGDFNGDGFDDDLTISSGNFVIGITDTEFQVTGSSTVIDNISQTSFSLSTESDARFALTTLEAQMDELTQVRGRIGSSMSRIMVASRVIGVAAQNYASAEQRIMAADIASEAAELTRSSILQQIGSAILAQANVQPSIALNLLRGG